MCMYIETKQQYSQFEGDELTDLLGQMIFQINNFGLWQSDHDTKASYISDDIEIVYYQEGVLRPLLVIVNMNVQREVF